MSPEKIGLEQPDADVLHGGLGVRHDSTRRDGRREDTRLDVRPPGHELIDVEADRLCGFAPTD